MQKAKLEETTFMRANEIANVFDCSKEYAYKIIRECNEELKKQGFLTMQGRLSRRYFQQKFFG